MKKWMIRDGEILLPWNDERETVRGILMTSEKDQILLMHYQKYNFYTLPGGGIENGESPQAAFIREVKEETGFNCDISSYLGIIEEHRAFIKTRQITHAYLGQISGMQGTVNLDETEVRDGVEVQIYPIFEAYHKIFYQPISTIQQKFLSQRDRIILQEGLKLFGKTDLTLTEFIISEDTANG